MWVYDDSNSNTQRINSYMIVDDCEIYQSVVDSDHHGICNCSKYDDNLCALAFPENSTIVPLDDNSTNVSEDGGTSLLSPILGAIGGVGIYA